MYHSILTFSTFLGIFLALVFIKVFRHRSPMEERQLYGKVLIAMQAVYVVLVVCFFDLGEFMIEFIALVLFIWIARVSMVKSTWILAIGFAMHGIWDFVHEWYRVTSAVPKWYLQICMIFDWVLAAYILYSWRCWNTDVRSG